jgi:hypothetical protein
VGRAVREARDHYWNLSRISKPLLLMEGQMGFSSQQVLRD